MVAGHVIAITVGAGAAVLMGPVALGMFGFTAGGIAAGSTAASLMSTAAVANGGGVAAGGLVACLQSAAAAGLSGTATVALGSLGAATGEGVRWLSSKIWK
ncbi:interferon alpha-inducible protein 27-like protein 2A [Osmerus eperlanus]|uniref:interferon alpha-inducible protein 27-like protein 2A n=1 Tax=Osmerus eperlanus TaxID=29151 RepID=UPI002E168962